MIITVNYRDSRPIYEQVKDNIRRFIAGGVLDTGDKLPSVRELASQLSINPNTIQRAYRELEAEGIIFSMTGKGSFVSETSAFMHLRKTELFHAFDSAVSELLELGISLTEIQAHLGLDKGAGSKD